MRKIIIVCLSLLFICSFALAKRALPPEVKPIIYRGIKFTVPLFKIGYVEAYDNESRQKVWENKVYNSPPFDDESSYSYVYIISLQTQDDTLLVTDTKNNTYKIKIPETLLQTNKLTKEQILQIAVNKARELGYTTEDMNIVYDEDNKKIKEHLKRAGVSTYNKKTQTWEKDLPTTPEQEYPELKDKDYQSVYFGPKGVGIKGGDLWVFVDKNTGEAIKYIRGE